MVRPGRGHSAQRRTLHNKLRGRASRLAQGEVDIGDRYTGAVRVESRSGAAGTDRLFPPGPDPAARYDAVAPAAETDAAVERGAGNAPAEPNEAAGAPLGAGESTEVTPRSGTEGDELIRGRVRECFGGRGSTGGRRRRRWLGRMGCRTWFFKCDALEQTGPAGRRGPGGGGPTVTETVTETVTVTVARPTHSGGSNPGLGTALLRIERRGPCPAPIRAPLRVGASAYETTRSREPARARGGGGLWGRGSPSIPSSLSRASTECMHPHPVPTPAFWVCVCARAGPAVTHPRTRR